MKAVEIEARVCQMCQQRRAEYAGLVCDLCKEAVDRGEGWTLSYPDLLELIAHWEGEERMIDLGGEDPPTSTRGD